VLEEEMAKVYARERLVSSPTRVSKSDSIGDRDLPPLDEVDEEEKRKSRASFVASSKNDLTSPGSPPSGGFHLPSSRLAELGGTFPQRLSAEPAEQHRVSVGSPPTVPDKDGDDTPESPRRAAHRPRSSLDLRVDPSVQQRSSRDDAASPTASDGPGSRPARHRRSLAGLSHRATPSPNGATAPAEMSSPRQPMARWSASTWGESGGGGGELKTTSTGGRHSGHLPPHVLSCLGVNDTFVQSAERLPSPTSPSSKKRRKSLFSRFGLNSPPSPSPAATAAATKARISSPLPPTDGTLVTTYRGSPLVDLPLTPEAAKRVTMTLNFTTSRTSSISLASSSLPTSSSRVRNQVARLERTASVDSATSSSRHHQRPSSIASSKRRLPPPPLVPTRTTSGLTSSTSLPVLGTSSSPEPGEAAKTRRLSAVHADHDSDPFASGRERHEEDEEDEYYRQNQSHVQNYRRSGWPGPPSQLMGLAIESQ
jgi:hypothetical protein